MSTLLHPAGPEPQETYWLRRAIVLVVLVVVLMLVIWALSSLFSRADDTGAAPVGPVTQTTDGSSPQATSDSSPSAAMSPSASPTGSASVSGIGSSPTPEASGTASDAATTGATPSGPTSISPAASSPVSSSPVSTRPTPTGPVASTAADVVPGITGATRVNTGRTVNLNVTLTTAKRCVLDFGTTGLETRIYSGTDRIWSSNDCSTHKPKGRTMLEPGKAWAYTIEWATKRSLGDCKLDSAFLLPGTYVATTVLSGGEPVQHVMTVLA